VGLIHRIIIIITLSPYGISLYVRNGARYQHSYYGMLIGTRMCSIEWCYFQCDLEWPQLPRTTPYSTDCTAFQTFV